VRRANRAETLLDPKQVSDSVEPVTRLSQSFYFAFPAWYYFTRAANGL
jgi:hypothetical protein